MSRVGVCSWSLRPSGPRDLCDRVAAAGLSGVQLALDPLRTGAWNEGETVAALRDAGIAILSGMMAPEGEDYSTLDTIRETGGLRPDRTWEQNLRAAHANAAIAQRLGIPLVTLHAGFLPHDSADPVRGTMLDRLRALADAFSARGIRIGLETGQESAELLLDYLNDLEGRSSAGPATHPAPAIGVNFDPANMLLYGTGDPVSAVGLLARHVVQVHIKDARRSPAPGEWGVETRAGEGEVDWPSFFAALRALPRSPDFLIERESGDDRLADIHAAARLVRSHAPAHEPPPPSR